MYYSQIVTDLFFAPRHAGLPSAAIFEKIASLTDASNQQQLVFYGAVGNTGMIKTCRYQVRGNPYWLAGAEWILRQLEKEKNIAILTTMTPLYWHDLFDIPKREKVTAISLGQAATKLYQALRQMDKKP